jgi:hypothetical protein
MGTLVNHYQHIDIPLNRYDFQSSRLLIENLELFPNDKEKILIVRNISEI